MKSCFENRTIAVRDKSLYMRLMELNDLKQVSEWPSYNEKKLLWANFNYRTEQERRYWYLSNSRENNFWFSLFAKRELLEKQDIKSVMKRWEMGNPPQMKRAPRSFLFKGRKEDLIVGRISTMVPENGDELIFGIALRPDMLEMGIGTVATQMYLFAVFALTETNSVWLETQAVNKRAQHVYEKIGFQKLGHHYKTDTMGRQEKRISYIFKREWQEKIPDVFIIV